jgi:hypothetical protein
MDQGHDSKKRSMTMASDKEGQVLNADDLKLAEMGYKPVNDSFSFLGKAYRDRNLVEGFP